MEFVQPTNNQVHAGLRAMRSLLVCKPEANREEMSFLHSVQRVWGTHFDVNALPPISPKELAEALPDPRLRKQVIAALTALSLYDGEAQPQEIEIIAEFAQALEVPDTTTHTLHQLAEGHLRRMRFDLIRRSWVANKLRTEIVPDHGLWGGLKTMLQITGKIGSDESLERSKTLEKMAPGTLGKEYHNYMVHNGFSLPGTKGAPPEMMMIHDCTHLLSGYGTTPPEEILVVGFSIGYMDQDPMDHLLAVLMQFHVGVQISPGAQAETGNFNPESFLRAVQRGAAMNINLNDRWDPWEHFHEQVDQLRIQYNIPPLAR
jgi:hypothetical protein